MRPRGPSRVAHEVTLLAQARESVGGVGQRAAELADERYRLGLGVDSEVVFVGQTVAQAAQFQPRQLVGKNLLWMARMPELVACSDVFWSAKGAFQKLNALGWMRRCRRTHIHSMPWANTQLDPVAMATPVAHSRGISMSAGTGLDLLN